MFQTVINAFQSTPPRGGRPVPLGPVIAITDISIHAPARGATIICGNACMSATNFNPRPREGGDVETVKTSPATSISIHAPARGATSFGTGLKRSGLFQSTPPRGGRLGSSTLSQSECYFNPRPREGGDSKDAQFYLRIFDKQVELLRFWGKMRGGCLRNPEKDRRFLGKSLANLPEISGHLDFAGA